METNGNMPDVMTLDQVAEYLQFDRKTVVKLIKDEQIPAKKLGATWRISRRLLDEKVFGIKQRKSA